MEGSIAHPSSTRIAVVTGANKGIGLEVCQQLASAGVTVVLTARDEKRGGEAIEKLKALGLSGGVIFHQLEITDASSIAALAEFVKARFGKLDILVNNAAVAGVEYIQEFDHEKFGGLDFDKRLEWMMTNVLETTEAAKETLQTNYYGTRNVIKALLPVLLLSSSEGRIVNVSSEFGRLILISNEKVRQKLNDIDNLTEEALDELLDKFLKDFEAGALEANGWSSGFAAYKVSKAALNAYTRIMARRHPALRINCAHPGYVNTQMTMSTGVLTPQEGASNVVKVGLLPQGGPTGVYFAQGQEASFL
uniref:Uncharacterized protein n=1 Tax=Avena sativa TaxID=4498 RepID=A0ACD5TQV2_AVESA